MILFGLVISFNVVFNYTFAAFLSPGNTEIFQVILIFCFYWRVLIFFVSIKSYTNEDYEILKTRLEVERLSFCKKCESFKPSKTHHCSICKQCVIRKDHHNGIFFFDFCLKYKN